jgi:UDP-N-acetylglucosamine diphosphorylase/glucosamine-1-phosphate N-acetyltransferase
MVDRTDETGRRDCVTVLYEPDELLRSFHPLTLTRPVGHLLFGAASIAEKIALRVGRPVDALLTAPGLHEAAADLPDGIPPRIRPGATGEAARGAGPFGGGALPSDTLFLSSGFLPEKDPMAEGVPRDRGIFFRDESGALCGFYLPAHDGRLEPEHLRNPAAEILAERTGLAFVHATVAGRRLEHLWNLVDANPAEVSEDVIRLSRGKGREIDGEVHAMAAVEGEYGVVVSEGATVEPFVFLDATRGPVFIARGAVVKAHSTIEGPAYVGEGTRILGGRIRGGTTIGPGCRVGGELEQSILQGYVNKAHDGFLGHAFVGSWVNFGAGSTNSDLKNNYRPVRVRIEDRDVDTGRIKVGAFIGDHVKTGIGTLMTTGFVCGMGCNLFGGRGVLPKEVPAFVWGDGEDMTEHRIDRFLETARTAMARRGVTMSDGYADFCRDLFERTAPERAAFLGG